MRYFLCFLALAIRDVRLHFLLENLYIINIRYIAFAVMPLFYFSFVFLQLSRC